MKEAVEPVIPGLERRIASLEKAILVIPGLERRIASLEKATLVIPGLERRIASLEKAILDLKKGIVWALQEIKSLTGKIPTHLSVATGTASTEENRGNLQNSGVSRLFKNTEEGATYGEEEIAQNANSPSANEAVDETKTIKVVDALPDLKKGIVWALQEIKRLTGKIATHLSVTTGTASTEENRGNLQNSCVSRLFKNTDEGATYGEEEIGQNANRPSANETVDETKTIKVVDALPERKDVKEEVGFEAEGGSGGDFAPRVAGTDVLAKTMRRGGELESDLSPSTLKAKKKSRKPLLPSSRLTSRLVSSKDLASRVADFLAKTMHRGGDTGPTADEHNVDPISDRAKQLKEREVRVGDDTGSSDLVKSLIMLAGIMLVVAIMPLFQPGIVLSTDRTRNDMNDRLDWFLENSKHYETVALPKIRRTYSIPYDVEFAVYALSYESVIKQYIVEVQSVSPVGP